MSQFETCKVYYKKTLDNKYCISTQKMIVSTYSQLKELHLQFFLKQI